MTTLPGTIKGLRRAFASLPLPESSGLEGCWQAKFTGPAWLRYSAPYAIALGGMPGWWGKEFLPGGMGYNLRRIPLTPSTPSGTQRTLAIRYTTGPSLVDGGESLTVQYAKDSPFPWTLVVDEFRQVSADLLLGMTIVNTGFLRRLAFPFLLERAHPATQPDEI